MFGQKKESTPRPLNDSGRSQISETFSLEGTLRTSGAIDISGLIVTKLDGSAKGGIVVSLADKFGIPIHSVGVGESLEDLDQFDAEEYSKAIVGLEKT